MIIAQVRNVHSALPHLVTGLFHAGPQTEIVERLHFNTGCAIHVQEPGEILTFWPELKRNPFVDLTNWIFEVAQDDPPIEIYVPETNTISIRRFDLGKDNLSRLAFLSEILRRRAGVEPRPLTLFLGEVFLEAQDAERLAFLMGEGNHWDPYVQGLAEPTPIITDPKSWDQDLQMFQSEGDAAMGYRNKFFRAVANPYLQAARALADNDYPEAFSVGADAMNRAKESDWKFLGEQYLLREYARWLKSHG